MMSLWGRFCTLAAKVLRRCARLIESASRRRGFTGQHASDAPLLPHSHLVWESERVHQALADHGIEALVLPSDSRRLSVLAVRESTLERVLGAMSSLGDGWLITIPGRRAGMPMPARKAVRQAGAIRAAKGLQVWCGHPLLATSQTEPHGIRLDFWGEVATGTDGEPIWGKTTRHGSSFRLSETAWTEQAAVRTRPSPLLFEVLEAIDVVYTWVDDADPEWRRAFEDCLASADTTQLHSSAYGAARFHEGDYLRFSLRSLQTYAPWVRHVYLVTAGQRPHWLDENCSWITVISHEEIFPDASQLPTFNSHAIEANLHRIPGLSERFLYLNDDVFFGDVVFPEDFFHGNGVTKFFPSPNIIAPGQPSEDDLPVDAAAKQTRDLVLREWGREPTHKLKHTPHALRRDVLAELDAIFTPELDRTRASRLRHPSDVSLTSSLAHAAGYATGTAVPGEITYKYVDVSDEASRRKLGQLETTRPYAVMCLNEVSHTAHDAPYANREVRQFLERYYPFPSEFERESKP